MMSSPARANRRASPLPSGPVPPRNASIVNTSFALALLLPGVSCRSGPASIRPDRSGVVRFGPVDSGVLSIIYHTPAKPRPRRKNGPERRLPGTLAVQMRLPGPQTFPVCYVPWENARISRFNFTALVTWPLYSDADTDMPMPPPDLCLRSYPVDY